MTEEEAYSIWKELKKLNKKIDENFESTSQQIEDLKDFFSEQLLSLRIGGEDRI